MARRWLLLLLVALAATACLVQAAGTKPTMWAILLLGLGAF